MILSIQCGISPFARVAQHWVPDDQLLVSNLTRDDGTRLQVHMLKIDDDFGRASESSVKYYLHRIHRWIPLLDTGMYLLHFMPKVTCSSTAQSKSISNGRFLKAMLPRPRLSKFQTLPRSWATAWIAQTAMPVLSLETCWSNWTNWKWCIRWPSMFL